MKYKWFSLALLFSVAFAACNEDSAKNIVGYAPIYNTDTNKIPIVTLEPRAIENGGKIYLKDNYCFQVETGKGIHVIDMSIPQNPKKLAYIQVAGAQEIAIKDDYLYTNSLNDLLIINISNIQSVSLQKRIPNAFAITTSNTPPESGYFECVDPNKGNVIGWEKKKLAAPKCKL